jgi:anti-sigma B factor antagonist
MQLEHESRDGIDIVRLPARLMMADAADAKAQLKEILVRGGGSMILDLTRTDFMDSSGCGVLVSSLLTARNKGGEVSLIGMGKNVRALFEMTRLHTVFQIFDDEDTALRAMH